MARLYSNQIDIGNIKYTDTKKVTCINIIKGNFNEKNNHLVNRFITEHLITKEIIADGEMEFVIINVDKIPKEIDDNEHRFIKWLRFITAINLEHMRKIGKDDYIMEKAFASIDRYFSGIGKPFDRLIADREYKAQIIGKKLGKKLGKELGKKQEKIEIAKNMLNNNEDIKKINIYTDLPLGEIKKLQKELK